MSKLAELPVDIIMNIYLPVNLLNDQNIICFEKNQNIILSGFYVDFKSLIKGFYPFHFCRMGIG